jgi:ankyrin repeat protein
LFAASTAPTRALGGPGVTPIPCPTQEWQPGDPAFEALAGAKAHFGKYDGGVYRIEIPEKWNGELVLFAHGFVPNTGQNGSNLRVGVHRIREHLVQQGFAWAASSYRCNGYVPGQGLLDTVALGDLFTKANDGRAPQRTYLTGESMGGHVTLLGMQEFPTMFAGGLAMCPAGPELFDYFAAVSAAAEVITGVQFHADSVQQDAAKMTELVGRPPDYTDKGRQLASVQIQISGGPRPFAVEGLASRFLGNMATSAGALVGSTTPSNRAIDTTHIKYAIDDGLGLTAEAINTRARRKAGDPAVRSSNGPYEEIVPFDGRIQRPLMTMHGTGDLYVPIFLEQSLKRAVVAAGNERLLTQRIYRIGAHCQFSQTEIIKAFDDLVTWVRQGTKPDGDEVLGDLSHAGLKFTSPLRANDPGGLTIKPAATSGARAPQAAKVDFGRDVQPIFKQNCVSCHGPAIHQNGFRLDQRSAAMRGGTSSPGVIRPGESSSSLLYMRVSGAQFGPQMPPTGALRPEQIATIKAWLDQGAEWPDEYAGETPPAPADPKAVRVIDALRSGDRAAFKKLAAEPGVGSLRGPGGSTPLMHAVLYGALADVRTLLDGGADPNAKNDAGATALMWATRDLDKTRMLLDRGAKVDAKSDDGRTALLVAAGQRGAVGVMKLLLDRGADPSIKAPGQGGETNAVIEAAAIGAAGNLRLLVERGADAKTGGFMGLAMALHVKCAECFEMLARSTEAQASSIASLVELPPLGEGTALTRLLEHGADPAFKDQEGSTLLMRAASSDVFPLETIKTLIARGIDVNATNAQGATALSIAQRHGRTTPVVDLLRKAGAKELPAPDAPAATRAGITSPRAAVERVLPLLQQTDVTFLKKSGCVSCHNNTVAAMTVATARQKGIRVDEETARRQAQAIADFIDGWRERALQGIGIPGDADTISYILLGLSAENYPANDATDAMARLLRRQQRENGQWRIFAHRPPIEASDIQVTAASMRALQVYAPRPERAAFDKAVQTAAAWLTTAQPRSTEERAFQLLGLGWAKASAGTIQKAARALLAEQRPDGGWSQIPTLTSDAYATGQALFALEQSGAIPVSDPAYARGVQFLLKTQLEDGSWYVSTRALPIQPYFESGFPHGRDQFISAAASNWAAMALALAVKPGS